MSASKEMLWPCSELGREKFDSGIIHCDPYVEGHSAIQWYVNNDPLFPPETQPPFAPFTNCPSSPSSPPRAGYIMYGCADSPWAPPQYAPPAGVIRIFGEYHLPWPLHSGIWIFRTTVTPKTSRPPPPNDDPSYYSDVYCALGSAGSMTPQLDVLLAGNGVQTTGDYVMNVYDVSLCACPQSESFDKYLTFIFDPSQYALQAIDIQMTGAFSSDFPPGFIA